MLRTKPIVQAQAAVHVPLTSSGRRAARIAWLMVVVGCHAAGATGFAAEITGTQWEEIELAFTAEKEYANPYTEVELHLVFCGPGGQELVRPAFWDGGDRWRVRFAAPATGRWSWRSTASHLDTLIVYLPEGGPVTLTRLTKPLAYQWFNPKSGDWQGGGNTDGAQYSTAAPSSEPWVLRAR